MTVTETVQEIRRLVREARDRGKTIGLVPTMGALHDGHLSLVRAAREACEVVVVSIFVNPTQFGPSEDRDTYPHTPEADLAACEAEGTDVVFMPSVETMYPARSDAPGSVQGASGRAGAATTVTVSGLTDPLCGRSRPTHFSGVCTIVAKLFNIVQPDQAFFGAKDFQQCVVIDRMTRDLDLPVEIVRCPIVREADGVAMSSRNALLTGDERRQASALHEALDLAERMILAQGPPAREVIEAVRQHLADRAPAGEVDYVQIVHPETLADVESAEPPVVVAVAVRFSRTRLIDNVLVEPGPGR